MKLHPNKHPNYKLVPTADTFKKENSTSDSLVDPAEKKNPIDEGTSNVYYLEDNCKVVSG